MPNHVTIRCVVTGPDAEVQRFRETVLLTKVDAPANISHTQLDFEAVIPMPSALKGVEAGSRSEEGAVLIVLRAERGAPFATGGLYEARVQRIRDDVGMRDDHIQKVAAEYLRKHPDVEEQGRLRLRTILETGYADWYSWSIANWGTKWNSYRFALIAEDPLEFTFETAWSFPTPVFEKVANVFPSLVFECRCFDEGWNFAGEGFFNPPASRPQFAIVGATDVLYERVYGRPHESEEEE